MKVISLLQSEGLLWQAAALLILAGFYETYFKKAAEQKTRGIETDHLARGKENGTRYRTELILKIASWAAVLAEVLGILFCPPSPSKAMRIGGVVCGMLGTALFCAAVYAMRDNWRAGIAEDDETELTTGGIYQISRNPAFLGFDLVYLGMVLIFFNWMLLAVSVFAAVMLHLQILQEEKFLVKTFGSSYLEYSKKVCRYFGRK